MILFYVFVWHLISARDIPCCFRSLLVDGFDDWWMLLWTDAFLRWWTARSQCDNPAEDTWTCLGGGRMKWWYFAMRVHVQMFSVHVTTQTHKALVGEVSVGTSQVAEIWKYEPRTSNSFGKECNTCLWKLRIQDLDCNDPQHAVSIQCADTASALKSFFWQMKNVRCHNGPSVDLRAKMHWEMIDSRRKPTNLIWILLESTQQITANHSDNASIHSWLLFFFSMGTFSVSVLRIWRWSSWMTWKRPMQMTSSPPWDGVEVASSQAFTVKHHRRNPEPTIVGG